MTGERLRERVGGLRHEGDKYYLENPQAFNQVVINNDLRVVARAKPDDKKLLTVGLQEFGLTVAVTGEGINDISALEISNVGFSMGSGVSAAKKASKMILIEDNILSIINSVLWGRNIFGNVRRFI